MNEEQFSNQTHPLPIKLPHALAETLGYDGQARMIAFYWGTGYKAYYDDGFLSAQAKRDAFKVLVHHPLLALMLQKYHLGSIEEEAAHWLLLDRDDHTLAVAPTRIAQQVLMSQWVHKQPEQSIAVDSNDWNQLATDVAIKMERISQEQCATHLSTHQQRVQSLAEWLERKWNEQSDQERQTGKHMNVPFTLLLERSRYLFGIRLQEVCRAVGLSQGSLSRAVKRVYQNMLDTGEIDADVTVGSLEQPTISIVMSGQQSATYYQVFLWLKVIHDEVSRVGDDKRNEKFEEVVQELWLLAKFVPPATLTAVYEQSRGKRLLGTYDSLIDHKERRWQRNK